MSNHGDTPEPPQNPYGQQPPGQQPPGQPDYGQPDYGQAPGSPYDQPAGGAYGGPPTGDPYGQPGSSAPYSVGDAFGYGFRKFQANLGPIIIAALVLFGAVVLVQLLSLPFTGGGDTTFEIDPDTGMIEQDSGSMIVGLFASLVFGAISMVVQLVIQSGIVKGALDITRGKPLSLGSMFSGFDFVQVVIAALVVAVATMIGFVLCILPGIAVLFLTSFSLYFIIDKGMGAIEAIQASVSFVMGNLGTLIVFFLASLAAYVVGALLCGIGLLVAIPVVVIAQAYTFRSLHNEPVAA